MRLLPLAVLVLSAQALAADDKPDLAVIHRIKAEAFERGQVMDHLFWLTDANGPRLTGSPGFRSAAEWAVKRLQGWGAVNARQEAWGTFGRGWSVEKTSARLVAPLAAPLEAVAKPWSSGTAGVVTGEVVYAPLSTQDDPLEWRDLRKLAQRIAAYAEGRKGTLKGKVVLVSELRELDLPKDPAGVRYDDPKLSSFTQSPEPVVTPPWEQAFNRLPADPAKSEALQMRTPMELQEQRWEEQRKVGQRLVDFFRTEGVLAVLSTDRRGAGGIVFTEAGGSWEPGAPAAPPQLVLTPESYNRLVRLVEHKLPVKVELEVQARFHDESPEATNVVGELPGGKKKDEVVMLGAHLDSWTAGTGATDNAAGSAVVLEAFRILKALNLPLDRTVRVALWSGEEQGLLGSRGYVKAHFGDPVTMQLKPEHARLAAYFNLDNGAGKIRGVYLQGNDMARPLFEQWLAPFRDLGVTTIAWRYTFGTDHLSFDSVGLPGFQFIQDPLDYMSRTHHSDLDVLDHALAPDLMQAAAVMASVVYAAANRADPVPRKPLPKPLPPRPAVVY